MMTHQTTVRSTPSQLLPRLEKFIPKGLTLNALRSAIINEPRHIRLLLMSTLEIGSLKELNDEQFRQVLRSMRARNFIPLEDYLTIPQRADKRFGGLAKVSALLLTEIEDRDLMEIPRYRKSLLFVLKALSAHKQIKLKEITFEMLSQFTIDDVYSALDAAHCSELEVRGHAGCLVKAAKMWGYPIFEAE